nr:immunoglobulin heavy chain junction region [Macaca mulatta]MOX14488.1 immunoglobulin heavy chain junction region [Macaca mulatta]MOX14525.1 immunoglobulin heavy chain junction region [Macaca mulatta]MOX14526.1 immunoglobulin heavy chain junction region [Macaca mulatta]MOX14531.1 immunoglobulin heavy chain junction region [Macaca mulatta]
CARTGHLYGRPDWNFDLW